MNKYSLVTVLFIYLFSFTVSASKWGVDIIAPLSTLDKYEGSDAQLGVGLDLNYNFKFLTVHAMVIYSNEMDALSKSQEDLGFSDITISGEYTSYGLAVSKTYNISKNFNIYGKLGVVRTESELTFVRGENQKDRFDISENVVFAGLGVEYFITKSWQLGLELNSGYSEIAESATLQFSVGYQF